MLLEPFKINQCLECLEASTIQRPTTWQVVMAVEWGDAWKADYIKWEVKRSMVFGRHNLIHGSVTKNQN